MAAMYSSRRIEISGGSRVEAAIRSMSFAGGPRGKAGGDADLDQGRHPVGQGHHRPLDLLGRVLLGAEVGSRQEQRRRVEHGSDRGHPRLFGGGFGKVAEDGEGTVGLVQVEDPTGCRPPHIRIVQGAEPLQGGQHVDRRRGCAGERPHHADPLLALVMGRVDGGQIADQQRHQAEPDDGLDEGQPHLAAAFGGGEPQRGQRGAADLEGSRHGAGVDAPEDEGEPDGDRQHPHQRETDQGDRRVQPPEVVAPVGVPPWPDQEPVGDGEHGPGDPGESVAGEDHRLQGRDQNGHDQNGTDHHRADLDDDHGRPRGATVGMPVAGFPLITKPSGRRSFRSARSRPAGTAR